MKVKVTLLVEVDPQRWRDEYGVADVREDIRDYVFALAQANMVTEMHRLGISVTLAD